MTAIPVSLEITGELQSIDSHVALSLFRVTQEALRNIQKHAAATQVRIHLSNDEALARLRITDNGLGFELDRLNRNHGLGLTSMEERIRFLGGSVRIESALGAGTNIRVSIPTRYAAVNHSALNIVH